MPQLDPIHLAGGKERRASRGQAIHREVESKAPLGPNRGTEPEGFRRNGQLPLFVTYLKIQFLGDPELTSQANGELPIARGREVEGILVVEAFLLIGIIGEEVDPEVLAFDGQLKDEVSCLVKALVP